MPDCESIKEFESEIVELYQKNPLGFITKPENGFPGDSKYQSPIFTICMCTYNHTELLYQSINSVLAQTFDDWELIILDNGSTNQEVWNIIENAMKADNRIKGIKGNQNVGWAKGTSICLEHAKGTYMTFLAADDCLAKNALNRIAKEIGEHAYDIIWVGFADVSYEDNQAIIKNISIPDKRKWNHNDRVQASLSIMGHVYYNSMFHYVKAEFLKKHKIDFYQPYYADCGAMTYAMTKAESMLVLDEFVYCLTLNTSQTMGNYIWDCYKITFASQWESLKTMSIEEGEFTKEWFQYMAARINSNMLSNFTILCLGANCRDLLMNNIEKSIEQRIMQLEEALSCNEIAEMMECQGRELYFKEICKIIDGSKDLLVKAAREGQLKDSKWFVKFINFLYDSEKVSFSELVLLYEVVTNPGNIGMFGYELFMNAINDVEEHDFVKIAPYAIKAMNMFAVRKKKFLLSMVESYIDSSKLRMACYSKFNETFHSISQDVLDILKEDEDIIKMQEKIKFYGNV